MTYAALNNRVASVLMRFAGYPLNPAAVALAIAVIWMR